MVDNEPEELGAELAQTLDQTALTEEAGATTKEALLPEVLTSFGVQFEENQTHIQHELLEIAMHDELNGRYTSADSITKESLIALARNYARDALHEYANALIEDSVNYKDLPEEEDGIFEFRAGIVDGYWTDTAQELIEQYQSVEA